MGMSDVARDIIAVILSSEQIICKYGIQMQHVVYSKTVLSYTLICVWDWPL